MYIAGFSRTGLWRLIPTPATLCIFNENTRCSAMCTPWSYTVRKRALFSRVFAPQRPCPCYFFKRVLPRGMCGSLLIKRWSHKPLVSFYYAIDKQRYVQHLDEIKFTAAQYGYYLFGNGRWIPHGAPDTSKRSISSAV